MKKINLKIVLGLSTSLVLLCAPVKADNFSVMVSQPAKAAKVSEPSIMTESFGNYGKAESDKMICANEKLILKEKISKLTDLDRFDGINCSKKDWFSKAPSKIYPQAVGGGLVFTPENFSSMSASLKNMSGALEKAEEPRKKRVSRLREPGESMWGGREKQS